MSVNEKILEKIRNLLSLAEDGGNDEESQTALLMAQKLMLKYKISQNELSEDGSQTIVIKSLSVYKRIYWWEKILVEIIAKNFRVMYYAQSNHLPHKSGVQRKLVLMGYPEDVELAYEMYHFAVEAMKHYAGIYLQGLKQENDRLTTSQLADFRKTFYRGFLDGLNEKFAAQRQAMVNENEKYALVIQTPQQVVDKYRQEVSGVLPFSEPNIKADNYAYHEGYNRGTKMNLTNQLLDQ